MSSAAHCRCGHAAIMHPADLAGTHRCTDTIALTDDYADDQITAPCECRAYMPRSQRPTPTTLQEC